MKMDLGRDTTLNAYVRAPQSDNRLRVTALSRPARLTLFLVATALALLTLSSGARAFTDVPPDRLEYPAITGLAVKGAVSGFVDGTFRPDSPATRAEFVKMVTAAMFLPLADPSLTPFDDLDGGVGGVTYPGGYVAGAYAAGIVKGKSATVFDPYGPLTRAEAMTIAVRVAAKLKAREFKPLPADYHGRFVDFKDPTHGENAKLAEANNLLRGIDLSRWDPRATATRAEAATIVWNLVGCFG